MSVFQIKIVAIVCMIISHVGIFFVPQYLVLRLIGSAAFPMFAWLIANGAYHTKDMTAYATRLFTFAVISQVPFTLANLFIGSPLLYLNVLFTLLLGLIAIAVIQTSSNFALKVVAVLGAAALAQVLNTDYGAAGVLSIAVFYLLFDRVLYMTLAQIGVLWILPGGIPFVLHSFGISYSYLFFDHPGKILGILAACACIAFYNQTEGIKLKYLFYAFYPVHYLGIFILRAVTLLS